MSWGVPLNIPDKEGTLTPLHLAVISGFSLYWLFMIINRKFKNCEKIAN